MKNFVFTIALCLPMGAAFAQTAGSITGEVKDQSGAMAPNASVTVTNSETNVARSTVTNADGIYSFPDLTRVTYQVKVAAAGSATVVRTNIELQVQQTASVDFSLSVGQAHPITSNWAPRPQGGEPRTCCRRPPLARSPRPERACARSNSR